MASRQVTCPSCKGLALYDATNPWRPFCSARCRNVDLGAWASEQFRVAVPTTAEDLSDDAAPPTPAAKH